MRNRVNGVADVSRTDGAQRGPPVIPFGEERVCRVFGEEDIVVFILYQSSAVKTTDS